MTATIIRYQDKCQVIEEDEKLIQKLDKHLSFFIQGAEHSRAFKGYTNKRDEFVSWDGCKHLMSSKGHFPNGLLERVETFYKEKSVPYTLIDNREPKAPITPISIEKRLAEMNKVPRQYQVDAATAAVSKDIGIIRMATGSGKTITATLITSMIGKKAVIYVIGKDLLYQIHKLFTNVFETEIGIIGDGKCEIRDINVVTIWSVGQALGLSKQKILLDDGSEEEEKIDPVKYKAVKTMLKTSALHLFDECHLAACDTIQEICKSINAEYVYGMSASPWRDDGADLLIEAVLGNKIVDVQAKWLIENKFLVKPIIRFFNVPKWTGPKKSVYQTVYSKYIVENDARNNMIVKAVQNLVEEEFCPLVLFHSIKHGDILFDKIKDKVPCAVLSGKDDSKRRETIVQELEAGKIKVLLASKIFDIGVDIPMLSGLVCAGAGKSSVRALQRIGRVIRPAPSKEVAAVVEFNDQAPFLAGHSKTRREIYCQEFEVE